MNFWKFLTVFPPRLRRIIRNMEKSTIKLIGTKHPLSLTTFALIMFLVDNVLFFFYFLIEQSLWRHCSVQCWDGKQYSSHMDLWQAITTIGNNVNNVKVGTLRKLRKLMAGRLKVASYQWIYIKMWNNISLLRSMAYVSIAWCFYIFIMNNNSWCTTIVYIIKRNASEASYQHF